MSEEEMMEARQSIEGARRSVAESTLLDQSFRASAEKTFANILARLADGSLTVEDALGLTKSLMDAVLIQTRHAAFQAKGARAQRLASAT